MSRASLTTLILIGCLACGIALALAWRGWTTHFACVHPTSFPSTWYGKCDFHRTFNP